VDADSFRPQAEAACLKSGAVREGAGLVRIEPINGPGVCGAEYPLKVAALGSSSGSFGFADDRRRTSARRHSADGAAAMAGATELRPAVGSGVASRAGKRR